MRRPLTKLALFFAGLLLSCVALGQLAAGSSAHQVSVNLHGENSGPVRITSAPSGIDCPGTCVANFGAGIPVVLTVDPGNRTSWQGFWFREKYETGGGNFRNGNCIGPDGNGDVLRCFLQGTDDAKLDTQFYLEPRPGITGFTINGGDVYTNDPRVQLSVRWPFGNYFMTASNDGGFGKSKDFDLQDTIPWTLQSSGPERLPKTVYMIFNGGGNRYTDDIILDETAPVISSATVGDAGGSSILGLHSLSIRGHARKVTLRVRARDRTSGVARIQVGPRKSRKLKKLKFRSRIRVNAPGRKLWVRVFDRAGNGSRWKLVRIR